MQIFTKYIIRNIIFPLLFIIFVITFIMWLVQSLKFVELIINTSISFWNFLYINLLIVPPILFFILPVAIYVAIVYSYNKLYNNRELLVLIVSGTQRIKLIKPAIIVTIFIMIIHYCISLYILPISNKELRNKVKFYKENYASFIIQEGVFAHPVNNLSIYIAKKDSQNNNIEGIFIHDSRKENSNITIIAEQGRFIKKNDINTLKLIKGHRQEIDKEKNYNNVFFDELDLNFNLETQKKSKKTYVDEMSIKELFYPTNVKDISVVKQMKAEAHFRIIWPLLSIIFVFISTMPFLSGEYSRIKKTRTIFIYSLITILLAICIAIINKLSGKNNYFTFIQYVIVLVTFFIFMLQVKKENS